ncbi:PREDICTED: uncharacterized protein LOC104801519 [Tarenaya hassleriana]|uniref:uncharacterized protein LOC104801519 n=1 Tax=Tarenaya hassleriana TaxID=28532 RepID=UPI0008FD8B3C|nr:PREDICTED: uncharacterized protein LOC104801519 [Tarenaya hassleriana]
MGSSNKWREAKSALGLNKCLSLPKTLHDSSSSSSSSSSPSSPSAGDAARPSGEVFGDPTRPESSSGSGPRFSKCVFSWKLQNTCAVCLSEIKQGEGQAIFTAECSHSFHFQCISLNVKHGNKICPLCRSQWNQLPVGGSGSTPNSRIRISPLTSPRDDSTLPSLHRWPGLQIFDDDDFLPHGEVETQNHHLNVESQALDVKLFPELSALPRSASRGEFAVLIHLKAEGRSGSHTRAPLDLITVLDVSGSMSGIKVELLKRAMAFVIQNLGPADRLSVVAFSSTARRLFPLKLMSETGKQEAIQAVYSLVADGGTNIAEGLKIGAKVITDRRWKNPVSGMMLLSDGQDNYTLAPGRVHMRTDYESLLPTSCRIPIHTFGFGSDHDAELLHTISEISSGTFSFIETDIVIQDAFAQCVGGLLSVVVQELSVEIGSIHPGLRISSVRAGSYRTDMASDGRTGKIDVGDLYAEEERDFLVILDIPKNESESTSLLKVRCDYKDPISKEIIGFEAGEVNIQRPREITREQRMVSIEVDRQRNRFIVADTMSEARVLADQGHLDRAVSLLGDRQKQLSETVSAQAGDSLCQALSAELLALQERMRDRRMYESTGRAYAFSSMSSHSSQRATARGDSTSGSSRVRAYQTTSMANMVRHSQELRLANPNPNLNTNPSLSPTSHVRRRLHQTLSFHSRQQPK